MLEPRLAALLFAALGLAACAGSLPQNADAGNCVVLEGCTGAHCCEQSKMCQSLVCEGHEYVCAVTAAGFRWLAGDGKKVACDDGDACTTNDLCVAGSCLGALVQCKEPPATTCLDATKLRTYAGQGSCQGGTCDYTPSDTTCPQGCQGAQCVGDPCLGVKCDKPPSACHSPTGTCAAGTCTYQTVAVGTACTTGDPCAAGTCDATGACKPNPTTCSAAHATGTCVNGGCLYTCVSGFANCNGNWGDGCEADLAQNGNCGGCGKTCTAANATGSCVAGACQFACVGGWGNCNGDWADGCEAGLSTTSNCGSCGKTCPSAAHANPSCSGGACKLTCISPYQNCDGSDANGCEIPVGVANRCDKGGLNSSSGCGTAWCGSSGRSTAANFTHWTCVFCEHCHHYSNGYSWCLSASGEFSSDRCSSCCNASLEDHVCPK